MDPSSSRNGARSDSARRQLGSQDPPAGAAADGAPAADGPRRRAATQTPPTGSPTGTDAGRRRADRHASPTGRASSTGQGADSSDNPRNGAPTGRRRSAAHGSSATPPDGVAKRSAEDETPPTGPPRKPKRGRRRRPTFWRELPLLIIVALSLTFLIQTFLAKVYVIPSGSMETTLHGCTGCTNDRVLVDKVVYRFGDPQSGDVVVFRGPDSWGSEFTADEPPNLLVRALQQVGSFIGLAPPDEKDFVKRVIATGGQTISCCDSSNRVSVNGKPLNEPYIYYDPDRGPPKQADFGPVTVPQGQLWVMGDSRNNSADSRVPGHGAIPADNVIGKVRFVVLPFSRFHHIEAYNPQTSGAVSMGTGAPVDPISVSIVAILPLVGLRRSRSRDPNLIMGRAPGRASGRRWH